MKYKVEVVGMESTAIYYTVVVEAASQEEALEAAGGGDWLEVLHEEPDQFNELLGQHLEASDAEPYKAMESGERNDLCEE